MLIFAFTMNVAQVQEMINASLQQQQAKAKEEVNRLKEQLKISNKFARDLKIEQAKKKFEHAGEKRAVGYLEQESLDLDEQSSKFVSLFPADEDGIVKPVITNENKVAVEEYLAELFDFFNMRDRFNRREKEAYQVALASDGNWLTEKFYRAEEMFQKDDKIPWYEKEELSSEKKLEKFRKAESDAKKKIAMRKFFSKRVSGRKFTRWDSPKSTAAFHSGSSQFYNRYPRPSYPYQGRRDNMWRPNFIPPMLQMAPSYIPLGGDSRVPVPGSVPKKTCFKCGEEGHIRNDCKK